MESALLDPSSKSYNNMNQVVKNWQDKVKNSIIDSLIKSYFFHLREKTEAWIKAKDIMILSIFSHRTKLARGSRVSEMVQYGFAQLCSFEHLAYLNTLKED